MSPDRIVEAEIIRAVHARIDIRAAGRIVTKCREQGAIEIRVGRKGRHKMSSRVVWPSHDPAARLSSPFRHVDRSEEHTSELQSLMRISYAVFCLKKKKIPETK